MGWRAWKAAMPAMSKIRARSKANRASVRQLRVSTMMILPLIVAIFSGQAWAWQLRDTLSRTSVGKKGDERGVFLSRFGIGGSPSFTSGHTSIFGHVSLRGCLLFQLMRDSFIEVIPSDCKYLKLSCRFFGNYSVDKRVLFFDCSLEIGWRSRGKENALARIIGKIPTA